MTGLLTPGGNFFIGTVTGFALACLIGYLAHIAYRAGRAAWNLMGNCGGPGGAFSRFRRRP